MCDFDSSDDDSCPVDTTTLIISWLSMEPYGYDADLGVSALPGCRFKDTQRSLKADIETIKVNEIEDVFVLCTKGELNKYRSYKLLESYEEEGIKVHHHPFPDGQTPSFSEMVIIIDGLQGALSAGRKALIHCYGGLGRSCLVAACLLLSLDEKLESGAVIDKVKEFRGSVAVQSIKQYNFINEFREKKAEKGATKETGTRSVSR